LSSASTPTKRKLPSLHVKTRPAGGQRTVLAKDRSTFLIHSAVKAPTAAKYERASQLFKHWAIARKKKTSSEKLADVGMCEYLTCLYEEGANVSEGRYSIYGWLFMNPVTTLIDKFRLPMSKKAIRGWNHLCPGNSRFPQPFEVICLLILKLLDICVLSAAAAILQYDGYLRPSEILAVLHDDVLRPSSLPSLKSTGQFGAIIGNADRAETTKTKQQDDTVMFGLGHRFWINKVVEILFHRTKPGESLFGSLSLAQYEERFRQASRKLKLPASITPHQLRHSGPSCDVLGKVVTLKEAKKRGRWLSDKSVARYEKHGRLLQQANRLPRALQIASIEATKELPTLLISKLTVNQ
jgi:hypothetical protein